MKIGEVYKSKSSSKLLKIVKKASGNGHWLCTQLNGSKQSHHIHEGTLKKYYEVYYESD